MTGDRRVRFLGEGAAATLSSLPGDATWIAGLLRHGLLRPSFIPPRDQRELRDLVLGARDIYLSSISNNLNQIMKTLTIISVIALPLTVVTGFFGMNFDEPIFHDHRWFIGALIFMSTAIAGMLYLFHRKRWI